MQCPRNVGVARSSRRRAARQTLEPATGSTPPRFCRPRKAGWASCITAGEGHACETAVLLRPCSIRVVLHMHEQQSHGSCSRRRTREASVSLLRGERSPRNLSPSHWESPAPPLCSDRQPAAPRPNAPEKHSDAGRGDVRAAAATGSQRRHFQNCCPSDASESRRDAGTETFSIQPLALTPLLLFPVPPRQPLSGARQRHTTLCSTGKACGVRCPCIARPLPCVSAPAVRAMLLFESRSSPP